MVRGRQARRILQLLAVFASIHHVAGQQHAYTSTTGSSKDPAAPLTVGVASTQPSTSTALLDRIGRLLSSIFPNEEVDSEGEGGFFGGDGSSLAWGGSTLEVVKTQATYLTRGAAFGPRITSEDGLKGGLLPISDFYYPHDHQSILDDNFGCPYKDGPGWRDEDFEEGDEDQSFQPAQKMIVSKKVKPPKNWIALIERGGNCSFASKVRVAQALGATAAVVGGGRGDTGLRARLVTMYAPGDISDIHIPSTFIARPSYEDLIRLISEIGQDNEEGCASQKEESLSCERREKGLEVVLGRDDIMWEWPLLDLAFILLLLPSFMTLTTIIVHRIRLARQRRRERAPEVVVLGLPCLIWRPDGQPWEKVEGSEDGLTLVDIKTPTKLNDSSDMELGNTQAEGEQTSQAGPSSTPLRTTPVLPPAPIKQHAYLPPGRTYYSCDECAICLSEFVDGDKVRVLPCGHVFHLPEIDSWLLRIKKLCPICKRDITVPIPPTPPCPSLSTAASPLLTADVTNDEAITPTDESDEAPTPTESTALLPRSA